MDEQLFPAQPRPAAAVGAPAISPAVTSQITSMATRLKLAEERYANLSKRNQITEESLLAFEREMKAELRALTKQSMELRKHISDMNTKVDAILGELNVVVQKPEFAVVERYMDLWQPMQFITADEAKRLLADALAEAARRGQADGGAQDA